MTDVAFYNPSSYLLWLCFCLAAVLFVDVREREIGGQMPGLIFHMLEHILYFYCSLYLSHDEFLHERLLNPDLHSTKC